MLGDNKENASERRAHTDTKTYTCTRKVIVAAIRNRKSKKAEIRRLILENETVMKEAWQEEVDHCERLAEQGGFFHSIDAGEAKRTAGGRPG